MSSAELTVEAWRDYDPVARELPGMGLGHLSTDSAAALHELGARCVRLPEPVTLCGSPLLPLVRDLTGLGAAVDWTAHCHGGCADHDELGHLFPPGAVTGVRNWREGYFPGRCVYRRGPGFVEVRDRRFGPLDLFVVDDPRFLDAISAMNTGAPVAAVPSDVLADLRDARLVAEHDGRAWWLPTRVHRWPFGSIAL